jgi:hypothetical protein
MRLVIISLLLFTALPAIAGDMGPPISKVPNDHNCAMALSLAKKATIDGFSNSLTREEVDWKLVAEYRIVGFWYAADNSCEVFDIMSLKDGNDRRSPHEIVEEDILEQMVRNGAISRYESGGNGAFYRLYD